MYDGEEPYELGIWREGRSWGGFEIWVWFWVWESVEILNKSLKLSSKIQIFSKVQHKKLLGFMHSWREFAQFYTEFARF